MFLCCISLTSTVGTQQSQQLQQDVEEVVDAVHDVTTSAAQPTTSSQVCFIYAIHDNVFASEVCLVNCHFLCSILKADMYCHGAVCVLFSYSQSAYCSCLSEPF